MRILHISGFALRGGCEKNCYHFIKGSLETEHELLVLDDIGPMSEDWQKLGISVKHLRIINKGILSFHKTLRKAVKGQRFDLVILWSTIRLPLQLNALNNVTSEVRVYLGNPLGHNPIKDFLLNVVFPCNMSAYLMACSSYVANTYKVLYYKSFPIKVSLNPIALPATFPIKASDPLTFRLGMVARLDPIKDHKTVITGFKLFQQKVPTSELHLVGDGALRKQLEDLVFQERLHRKVFFHGDVQNVYDYLNKWDIFVYATTLKEGLGSVVAEAMANGLPCVLSDLPMLRELAPKDGLALWFKPEDNLELMENLNCLYNDPLKREQLGKSAFEHARSSFSVERFIKDYIS